MTTPTCADRINGELKDRAEQLREIFGRIDAQLDPDSEEALEELDTLALSIETQTVYRIVLSTGGPHDELVATVDPDGDLVRLEYGFMDWFDGARQDVDRDSDEGSQLARFAEYLLEAFRG